ncbi:ABC transporter ATP-binding protein/permease [Acholeplasma sp. OttesenSCG-928-E16]|nr:ABC transporter ATP-binding protein/permease [Acholeplasma sp. OttesenSCG-928-E16]
MIKVNQVNKYFNKGRSNQIHVISDTTLEFDEKGLVVLLGASGSGKTTLLNVIGGLDKVNNGSFEFEGKLIKKYSSKIWDKIRNEKIGYIFQNYNLLPQLTVYDNIAFVLKMVGINDKEVIDKNVKYVLEATNMYPYRHKKALQLSGGQMQRVAIARALVKNPKVIIADEPTGNLDSKNTSEIMNIIKAISKEKLVVLVTHDKDLAHFYGDRIIEIKDGVVQKDGINNENVITEYGEDNNIYLKDLKKVTYIGDQEEIGLYFDEESKKEEIDVKLIVKNNVLYLKLDSKYKNVQILDDKSTIGIIDDNYKPKSKYEATKTDYDIKALDIESEKTKKRKLFSFKNAVLMTINHFFKSKVKMSFMMISFVISGLLIALSTALIFSQVDPDLGYVVERSEKYVVINSKKRLSYDTLNMYVEDYGVINPHAKVSLNYIIPKSLNVVSDNLIYSQTLLSKQLDVIENISAKDLVRGRMPSSENEIVVAEHFLVDLVNNKDILQSLLANGANAYGYWSPSDFINEKVSIIPQVTMWNRAEKTVKIVGTTNKKTAGIYMRRIDAYKLYGDYDVLEFDSDIDTKYESLILDYYNDMNYSGSQEGINYFIYTENQTKLINHINQFDSLTAVKIMDYYQGVVRFSIVERVMTLVAFAFGLIAALGFYFIIRSSMISRIYEISIYRALGVSRFEIIKSFIVEIIGITIVSSLIGFILTSIGLYNFNQEMINIYPIFKVDFTSVLVGIIILFSTNLLFGLWPLLSLLSKTPAQIISKYDI